LFWLFCSVEFFKLHNVFGFRCQVSGVSKPMTEGETA
jgi:hypothetical protein